MAGEDAMDVVWQSTQVYCAGLDTLQRQIAEESTRPAPSTPALTSPGSSSSSSLGSQSSQGWSQPQRRPRGRPPRKGTIVPTETQLVMKERLESLVVATVSNYVKQQSRKDQKRPKAERHSVSEPAATVRDADAMDVDSATSSVPPQKRPNAERPPRSSAHDASGHSEPGGLLGMHPRRAAMHPSASTPALPSFASASSVSSSASSTSSARDAAPAPAKPPPPRWVSTSSQSQSQTRPGTKVLGMRRPPTFVAKTGSASSGGPKPFKPPLASAAPVRAAPARVPSGLPAPAPAPARVPSGLPAAAPAPAPAPVPPAASAEPEDEADTSDTSFGSISFDLDSDTIEAICSQYDRPA